VQTNDALQYNGSFVFKPDHKISSLASDDLDNEEREDEEVDEMFCPGSIKSDPK